ncbi:hypothetical protein C8R44DRAFT_980774 [Mycena epipterygia]|nr:hypothetical protein C8R44DRAFT_980774 [Mycena epipterygia]
MISTALLLFLYLSSSLATATPIYTPPNQFPVEFPAYARAEVQVETLKLGQSGGDSVSDISSPLALNVDSGAVESSGSDPLSSWSDESVAALVAVLLLFVMLNLGGFLLLLVFIRRQRRELVDIQLREVAVQQTLQAGARHLSPPLPPPPNARTLPGQMFSTDSTVTLVPYVHAPPRPRPPIAGTVPGHMTDSTITLVPYIHAPRF